MSESASASAPDSHQQLELQPPTVLVAHDGSPAAATALQFAHAVARQLGTRVEILHVAPSAALGPVLHQRLSGGLRTGAAVPLRWATGDPVDEILKAAADPAVEVVVLTTHGRAVQHPGHLGHVTAAVIGRTPHPVLLVRPEAAPVEVRALERLLLPLDGTPKTAAALRPATELAHRLGASIDVLYIANASELPLLERGALHPPRYVDQPHYEWPQWRTEVVDRLCGCLAECPVDVPVRVHLVQGHIGPEIARFAREQRVDAIVLVRRSQFESDRAPVLHAVLECMPCPILLVPGEP